MTTEFELYERNWYKNRELELYNWIIDTTKENVERKFLEIMLVLNNGWLTGSFFNKCLFHTLNMTNYSMDECFNCLNRMFIPSRFNTLKPAIYRYYEHLHLIYCLDIKSKENIINLF
jgi:hypothetical protein